MSEMEDLKKSAEESKAIQTVQAISRYLDRLTARIAFCEKRHWDSTIVYTVAWLAWVIVGFFDMSMNYGFAIIFMFSMVYDQFRFTQLRVAHGEFYGAVEILRLLGYVNFPDPRERKEEPFWSEGIEMVKGWFKQKKEAQEAAYVPA